MNKFFKVLLIIFSFIMVISLTACNQENISKEPVTIKWWSLPVFGQDETSEKTFLEEVATAYTNANSNVTIEIYYMNQETYIEEISQAKQNLTLPDVIFFRAEDAKEVSSKIDLVDLKNIITSEDAVEDISNNILSASSFDDNKTYQFCPISVTPYLMGFNKSILEEYDMLSRLSLDGDRSWKFEDFSKLLTDISEKLAHDQDTGIFYYGSTAGITGSQSLIKNMSGGSITDQSALDKIKKLIDDEVVINGYALDGMDSLDAFISGQLVYTPVYTLGYDVANKNNKKDSFETIFMPYPTEDGSKAELEYTLLGASVVNNSDENRLNVAKDFVNFIANNKNYAPAVAGYTGGISVKKEFNSFLEGEYKYLANTIDMLGDYYSQSRFESEESQLKWLASMRDVMYFDKEIN